MQNISAAWLYLSGLFAGVVVDHFGYSVTFLSLGAAACIAFATLLLAMPETADQRGTGC